MKLHRLAAASFIAALATLIAGCATDTTTQQAAAAQSKANCAGVAPAVGSMIVRKEDCSAQRAMSREEIEEFRRSPVMTAPVMGKGVGG